MKGDEFRWKASTITPMNINTRISTNMSIPISMRIGSTHIHTLMTMSIPILTSTNMRTIIRTTISSMDMNTGRLNLSPMGMITPTTRQTPITTAIELKKRIHATPGGGKSETSAAFPGIEASVVVKNAHIP